MFHCKDLSSITVVQVKFEMCVCVIALPCITAEDPTPVVFAINKNLFVIVKIVNCKCFYTAFCLSNSYLHILVILPAYKLL